MESRHGKPSFILQVSKYGCSVIFVSEFNVRDKDVGSGFHQHVPTPVVSKWLFKA